MYQDFYGLMENPFILTPDPQYLYLTPRHKEALAQLFYQVINFYNLFYMNLGDV